MKKKQLFLLLLLFFSAAAALAGYKIYAIVSEYKTAKDTSGMLRQYIELDAPQPSLPLPEVYPDSTEAPAASAPEVQPTEPPADYPAVDFETLLSINEDVVGWIYMEDTAINYPIVQAADNTYYVSHMVDGNVNSAGSIFMDYRSEPDFSDRHTVIYGHNMRDGSMFAGITEYKDAEFFTSHPTGMIMTPERNFQFEIIAGYVAGLDENAWQLKFDSEDDFSAWLRDTMARSAVSTGIVPDADDHIITLSTCSYEFPNARFVLVCRILP